MAENKNPDVKTKKKKKRERLLHGIYAKDVILPFESEEQFERLHSDLRTEFSPNGRAEDEAVLDLAMLHWQKRTIWRLRQAALLKDPFMEDIVATRETSWSGIQTRLRETGRRERTVIGSLEAATSRIVEQIQEIQQRIVHSSDANEREALEQIVGSLARIMSDHAIPLLQALQQSPNAQKSFDNFHAPESLAKLYQLETILDNRIAKVLSRLVGLKEFKRTPAGNNRAVASPAPLPLPHS